MNEAKNEVMRRLIELAVSAGRKLQSEQTGYLHHYYSKDNEETSVTIPSVENVLFALALLRSRIAENGVEAKALLEKLLHFQHPQGNFPIYLHEYPECKDRFVAVHVSVPMFWILKYFHHVLGSDLNKKIENALARGIQHSLQTLKEKPAPYYLTLKIAALAKAGGSLLFLQEIEREGQRMLDELKNQIHPPAWYSPSILGSILSSLQMVYPRLDFSPWHPFWNHLENTCHKESCAYIGPSVKEYQVEFEPQVTLYDLYLGYFTTLSPRCLKEQPVHLEGALLHPSDDQFKPANYPLSLEGVLHESKWKLSHKEKFSISFIEKGSCYSPCEKGYHFFRLIRKGSDRVHTLVCQGGNFERVEMIDSPDKIELIFHLENPVTVEDREKNREVGFCFEVNDATTIHVDGQQATTFALGEPIKIKSEELSLTMTFTLEQGNGRFLGHLMRGNRHSQLHLKGAQRLNAYDWQLFLRTIQRQEPCKIKVLLMWS